MVEPTNVPNGLEEDLVEASNPDEVEDGGGEIAGSGEGAILTQAASPDEGLPPNGVPTGHQENPEDGKPNRVNRQVEAVSKEGGQAQVFVANAPTARIPTLVVPPSKLAKASLLMRDGLVLAIPLVAVVCLILHLSWWTANPAPKDWQEVEGVLAELWEAGDILRVEPTWATGGLRFFSHRDLDQAERVEPREMHRHSRIWVAGHIGHRDIRMPPVFNLVRTWQFSKIDLHLYEIGEVGTLLYDGRERLAQANVRRVPPLGSDIDVEVCGRYVDGTWYCGSSHPWQNVRPERFSVGGAGRDVIWAHPLNGNRLLEVAWPKVPLTDSLELQLGWTTAAFQNHNKGAPTSVELYVAGELVHSEVVPTGRQEWAIHEIDVSRWKGTRQEVKVVSSTSNYSVRQLLFQVRSWEGHPSW